MALEYHAAARRTGSVTRYADVALTALASVDTELAKQFVTEQLGPLAGQVAHVRLVHGEVDQAEALAKSLTAKGFQEVVIPNRGESVQLS